MSITCNKLQTGYQGYKAVLLREPVERRRCNAEVVILMILVVFTQAQISKRN